MARRQAQGSDPSANRERILAAATAEFATVGIDGGRVDRIAKRSGLSKNMLYYYFKSKENLFLAVLERTYESLRERQKDFPARDAAPLAVMAAFVRHTFAALEADPAAIRLMNEENKHRARYLRRSSQVRGGGWPLLDIVTAVLDRGAGEGVFRPGLDPAAVYLTVSSMCYHFLSNRHTLEIVLDRDLGSAAAREAWLDHVTEVVLLACLRDPALLWSRIPKAAAARPRSRAALDKPRRRPLTAPGRTAREGNR